MVSLGIYHPHAVRPKSSNGHTPSAPWLLLSNPIVGLEELRDLSPLLKMCALCSFTSEAQDGGKLLYEVWGKELPDMQLGVGQREVREGSAIFFLSHFCCIWTLSHVAFCTQAAFPWLRLLVHGVIAETDYPRSATSWLYFKGILHIVHPERKAILRKFQLFSLTVSWTLGNLLMETDIHWFDGHGEFLGNFAHLWTLSLFQTLFSGILV